VKNNKGMTLVELIVALAISAILLATISGILYTSLKAFNEINKSNEDKIIGDTIYEFVANRISTASGVEIKDEQTVIINNSDTISINSKGRLLYNGIDLYGDVFYENRTLSISVSKNSSDTVNIYVYVFTDNKQSYSVGSVVKMLNYKFE